MSAVAKDLLQHASLIWLVYHSTHSKGTGGGQHDMPDDPELSFKPTLFERLSPKSDPPSSARASEPRYERLYRAAAEQMDRRHALQAAESQKQEHELAMCSFQPKIVTSDRHQDKLLNREEIFDRLHKSAEVLKEHKKSMTAQKRLEEDTQFMQECTFQPKIIHRSKNKASSDPA
eukprot:516619_1